MTTAFYLEWKQLVFLFPISGLVSLYNLKWGRKKMAVAHILRWNLKIFKIAKGCRKAHSPETKADKDFGSEKKGKDS